jgi:hypothetical protein
MFIMFRVTCKASWSVFRLWKLVVLYFVQILPTFYENWKLCAQDPLTGPSPGLAFGRLDRFYAIGPYAYGGPSAQGVRAVVIFFKIRSVIPHKAVGMIL